MGNWLIVRHNGINGSEVKFSQFPIHLCLKLVTNDAIIRNKVARLYSTKYANSTSDEACGQRTRKLQRRGRYRWRTARSCAWSFLWRAIWADEPSFSYPFAVSWIILLYAQIRKFNFSLLLLLRTARKSWSVSFRYHHIDITRRPTKIAKYLTSHNWRDEFRDETILSDFMTLSILKSTVVVVWFFAARLHKITLLSIILRLNCQQKMWKIFHYNFYNKCSH